MRKRFHPIAIIFISLIIVLSGCSKVQEPDNCLSFSKGPVIKVEGATTGSVNQEIVLNVFFSSFNGCGGFGNFAEVVNGDTTTITVNAKYVGCICTQDVPTRQGPYSFKRMAPGTYTLRFVQAENNYLFHTIVVQ